jgi:hypothetical protein
MGIFNLVVFLVIAMYSFLIISCFISNKEIFLSQNAYKMVISPKQIIVLTKM